MKLSIGIKVDFFRVSTKAEMKRREVVVGFAYESSTKSVAGCKSACDQGNGGSRRRGRTSKVGPSELGRVVGEEFDLVLGEADEGEDELLEKGLDVGLEEVPGRYWLDAAKRREGPSAPPFPRRDQG